MGRRFANAAHAEGQAIGAGRRRKRGKAAEAVPAIVIVTLLAPAA